MRLALSFDCANAGNNIAAKIAMIAITTRSSTNVKPRRSLGRRISILGFGRLRQCVHSASELITELLITGLLRLRFRILPSAAVPQAARYELRRESRPRN